MDQNTRYIKEKAWGDVRLDEELDGNSLFSKSVVDKTITNLK
jgi:hypothetical protein